jgi:hypothetical protein
MGGGAGIGGQVTASRLLLGEVGREALVEALDGNVEPLPQCLDERFRLPRLLAALATRSGASSRIIATSSSRPAGVRTRSTTPTGRASVPVGSETAIPVRAEP